VIACSFPSQQQRSISIADIHINLYTQVVAA
jgi:hypothetical protein